MSEPTLPPHVKEFLTEVDDIQAALVRLRISCPRQYYKLRQGLNDAFDLISKVRVEEGVPL